MMTATDNISVVRLVGPQAKYNTARHSLGILRPVIVTCRYRIPATHLRRRQPVSLHDAVENAVARVVVGQALLGVGIVGEDSKDPAFVHLKTIDMLRMIEWKEIIVPATISDAQLDKRNRSESKEEREKAYYEDRLFRSLEKLHEPMWEDLAGKPGWKVVVHHDPQQLGALKSRESLGSGGKAEENNPLLSFDVSFCFHHAYADGRGGYIFHGELQRALNDGARPAELRNHILYLPKPPLLPPPMDTLIPFSLSWTFIFRTVWSEVLNAIPMPLFFRRLLRLEPSEAEVPWTGAPVDASNPKIYIRTIFRIEDESQLKGILARCRTYKASLTGLLHALIARSLARHVQDRTFCSMTPISLAGYSDQNIAGSAFTPGETIHCLVTGLSANHDLDALQRLKQGRDDKDTRVEDDVAVWAFAQDMTARLRTKTSSLPRDDILALSGLIGDWHEFFRKKIGKPRDGTWELSNLGSLSVADAGISRPTNAENGQGVEQDERWFIDHAVFTQGNAVGAALNINVAGVAEHGIHVTASWQEGIVDVDLVERLAGDLQAWVAELVDN
ncbi:hypothetical protein F5Y03DRAFT_353135 [Xylaria venustula]|nr:hypothetical protein F5Y03DRAFT_353135 [Xylaria venustula]